MLLVLATVAIVAAGVTSLLSYRIARQSLERQAFEQLTAVREMKGNQVEDYIRQISDQLVSQGESKMIVAAVQEFQTAFNALDQSLETDPKNLADRDLGLRNYYQNEFLQRLDEHLGETSSLTDYWPQSSIVRYLQSLYIADNSMAVGSKHLLDGADDESDYSTVHRRYHPLLRNFLERFGYYDIFLIDNETGNILYTVFKEVDFGTSLLSGPYRDSNLARAFQAARTADAGSFVRLEDFETYAPSYGAQASFIATPIYEGDKMLGVLVFQMPVDRINRIMTSREQWENVGLGKSGETYVIGDDLTLRNQSRFLIEDRENYLSAIRELGVPSKTVDEIAKQGSSIGLQEVRSKGTLDALAGHTGQGIFSDYRGVDVLSAYRPLDLPDVKWVIMSEIDQAEALAPARSLRDRLLLALLGLIVAIVIVAVWFSGSLTRPLKRLASDAERLAAGHLDQPIKIKGHDEIADLSRSFEAMRKSLEALVQKQEREIDALAVPLIPLRKDVMVMPLVGELDERRLEKVRLTLVQGMHDSGAKSVLLDLTGVSTLDPAGAAGLIRAAKAARLLGVRVIVTGMRPDVAKDLSGLGLYLDGIDTERTLAGGIEAALTSPSA